MADQSPNPRGLFVTFEGVDGAGKSTQLRLAAEFLREQVGRTVTTTREPGGSPGAEEIRSLLVSGAPQRWSATTELLLFNAARRDHLERTIEPALVRGEIVLCDRFVDSTRAYQAAGRGADAELVERIHALTIDREADLTLIFDLDPKTAGVRGGAGEEDRYEQLGEGFQATLRRAFLDIAAANTERCRVIDAGRPIEDVAADAIAAIRSVLDETRP